MGSDKRVSRSERSGRYGSAFDREDREDRMPRSRRRESNEYKRYREERDDRYDDYRDYDSPDRDRDRERRNSDRSEDGYHSDGEYVDNDYRNDYYADEKESKTIMLRGLPINITENDIREVVETFEGPQPVDVRLMKRKTGLSRGFAFVEFYHLQDATSWMEANQVASLAKSRILLRNGTYVCNRDREIRTRTGGGGEGKGSQVPRDLDKGDTVCVHSRYLPLQ